MQLETLRDFILLSESLSFSGTAKQLYISQSVLSKRIAALETELRTVLFVRDKHSVRLTTEGKLLATRMREVIESYDSAIKELELMRKSIWSILKIGYIHGATREFLPEVCHEFSTNSPETALELHSLEADQVVKSVQTNAIDIGVTTFFENCTPETLEHQVLFHDSCGVLLQNEHRLAERSSISLDDLAGETILVPNAKTFPYYSRFVSNVLDKEKYTLTLADEMYDISMVPPFLATRRGIALTMTHLVPYYGSSYKYVPLDEDKLTFSIVAMWKKAHERESILQFVKYLEHSAQRYVQSREDLQ